MPGKIIETHIGPAPMRSVPVTPCSSALISDKAWRYSSSISLTRRASTSPCLVSATPVGKRSNSGTPMVFSSWRMLRVSAG